MIGTVTFIRCRGSPITGEYPLISSTSSLTTRAFENCKFTEDLNQRLVLAEFDDYTSYNCVLLTSGTFSEYYWINDVRRSSTALGAVEFDIAYNAPTSFYSSGEYVSGYWQKAPVNLCKYIEQQVSNGNQTISSQWDDSWYKTYLNAYSSNYEYELFWVQVTSTDNMTVSATTSGEYMRYGFPIAIRRGYDALSGFVHNSIRPSVSGNPYPTLDEFISNPEQFGFTASNIIDISLSEVIPYAYSASYDSTDGSYSIIFTLTPSSGVISPIQLNGATEESSIYRLEQSGGLVEKTYTYTITLTDKELSCGQIVFKDANSNIVMNVDKSYVDTTDNSLTITMRMQCDYSGITHILGIFGGVNFLDESGNVINENRYYSDVYELYSYPTTHLPYVGSAWDEYVKYSLTYDRESMQNSISYNNQSYEYRTAERAGNVAGSLVSMIDPFNFLTGGIGNALGTATSNAVSTAVDAKQTQLENRMLQFNQDLQERRVQGQAGVKYNPQYGIAYITSINKQMDGLYLYMPAGCTDTMYSNYVDAYGYPVEGKLNLLIQTGYYKGMPLPDTAHTDTGIRYQELVNAFMNGVRYVEPSYPTAPSSASGVVQ